MRRTSYVGRARLARSDRAHTDLEQTEGRCLPRERGPVVRVTSVAGGLGKQARETVLHTIPRLAPAAIDSLMAYEWPGNVRELENAVQRAIILARGQLLAFDSIGSSGAAAMGGRTQRSANVRTLRDAEAADIKHALYAARGRVEGRGGAAELLDIHPGTLRFRMKKLGISYGRKKKG